MAERGLIDGGKYRVVTFICKEARSRNIFDAIYVCWMMSDGSKLCTGNDADFDPEGSSGVSCCCEYFCCTER